MRSAKPLEAREDPASSAIAQHNLALRIIGIGLNRFAVAGSASVLV
jgi:hypothetical protein